MNIPTLPTDNLYKFMAIFGLILIAISILLFQTKMNSISVKAKDAYVVNKADSVLVDLYEEILLEHLDENGNPNKRLKLLTDSLRFAKRNDLKIQYPSNPHEGDFELEMYDKYYKKKVSILAAIGIILSGLGFALWYFKHQIYIDAERKWKGLVFIELLKDEEAKKKAIEDELNKTKDSDKNSIDTPVE